MSSDGGLIEPPIKIWPINPIENYWFNYPSMSMSQLIRVSEVGIRCMVCNIPYWEFGAVQKNIQFNQDPPWSSHISDLWNSFLILDRNICKFMYQIIVHALNCLSNKWTWNVDISHKTGREHYCKSTSEELETTSRRSILMCNKSTSSGRSHQCLLTSRFIAHPIPVE